MTFLQFLFPSFLFYYFFVFSFLVNLVSFVSLKFSPLIILLYL